MAAVDEHTKMTRCIAGSRIGCIGEERCLTHGLWAALGRHIQSFLGDVSLQDVIDGGPALNVPRDRLHALRRPELAAE